MKTKYIVYVTVNLCNGKLYFGVHHTNPEVFDGYIGNGVSRHRGIPKDNTAFQRAVRKYGYENFRRTTIAVFPDTEEGKKAAYKLEEEIVNPTLLKSKNVYNIRVGGISNAKSENVDQKKRVYQFALNGNYMRSYKSAREAAIAMCPDNIENTMYAIRNCCQGMTHSSNGYYWSYFKEFIKYDKKRCGKEPYKIAQYSLSGKFLRYFNNIQEARLAVGLFGIHYAIIYKTCLGGYQWRWYTNDNDIEPYDNNKMTKHRYKSIIMTFPDGKEVEYKSIKQCIELNPELKSVGINRVLREE